MYDVRIVETIAILFIFLIVRAILKNFIKKKTRMVEGHENLIQFMTFIILMGAIIYILNVWGWLSELLGIFATLGVIAVALIFTLKDVWISNVFASISLDKMIKVGADIEINGQRGRIVDLTLTTTKIMTKDGRMMIVPNMRLKQDIVIIKLKK